MATPSPLPRRPAVDPSPLATRNSELLIAWSKRLVAAESFHDLDQVGRELFDCLPVGRLAIYRYEPERFKRMLDHGDVGDKVGDKDVCPEVIAAEHPAFTTAINANASLPTALDSGGWHRLPIKRSRQLIGFMLLQTTDAQWVAVLRPVLRRVALMLLQSERRLRQQDQRRQRCRTLHQLVTNTDEAFCSWTRQRGWEFHNRHLLFRIGYQPDHFALRNIFGHPRALSNAEWRRTSRLLNQCIRSGQRLECEYSVTAPDGELRYFACTLNPTGFDANGSATALAGVSVDVTDSKRLDLETSANIQLEQWLIEQTRLLFNQCDVTAVQQVLRNAAHQFALDRCLVRSFDDAGDSTVYAEWYGDGVPPAAETLPRVRIDEPKAADEFFISDAQDDTTPKLIARSCAISGVRAIIVLPLRYNDEVLGYIICHNRQPRQWGARVQRGIRILADTLAMVISKETILKRLAESRERFQMAMQAASYGLWELNLLNQTIYLSPTYYSMLGYDSTRFGGFNPLIVDNVHIDDKQMTLDYAQALADGTLEEFSQEARHITVNGDLVWILMRGRVVKWDESGRPVRAMGTLTDITALKKAQTDLQLAYQAAESAHVAKSEFLARMSHEIRTPMNAIIGMAYLAQQTPLNNEQQRNLLDIENAAKSLLQIIDDILDFSKIEANKLCVEYHDFNFHFQIEELAQNFRARAEAAGLTFQFTLDPAIPVQLRCDSVRLQQVIANLLSNAIKFTRRGSVSLDVRMQAERSENFDLAFTVSDTGIGLNTEQLETLFDPFTQADGSSTRQFGGTGLGLAISKHLITMMQGEISVESEAGSGSRFCFTVRCEKTGSRAKFVASPEATDNGEDIDLLRGKRILLVEDNKVNQKVAAGIMRHRGMEVTIANDGTEGVYMLKASEAGRFDLVLMDIEMPQMGGFEAAAAIRAIARHQELPIVAMTAHLVDGDKARYLDNGMNDCISKPINPADLCEVIARNLHGR